MVKEEWEDDEGNVFTNLVFALNKDGQIEEKSFTAPFEVNNPIWLDDGIHVFIKFSRELTKDDFKCSFCGREVNIIGTLDGYPMVVCDCKESEKNSVKNIIKKKSESRVRK